jgi:hypothetical protein
VKGTDAEIVRRKYRLAELLANKPDAVLTDVLDIYPPVAFAREFGLNASSFPAKIEQSGNIRVGEIRKIAAVLGISPRRVFQLVNVSIEKTSGNTVGSPASRRYGVRGYF